MFSDVTFKVFNSIQFTNELTNSKYITLNLFFNFKAYGTIIKIAEYHQTGRKTT